MSHFTEIEVDFDQKNEAQLVAALEKEFGEGTVEVNDAGSDLFGYQGDNRSKGSKKGQNYAPPCEIRIDRKVIGSASNDIGYKRLENGKYAAYVSDYDKVSTFGSKRQGAVLQEYGLSVAEKELKAKGWYTKRINLDDGYIRVQTTGKAIK